MKSNMKDFIIKNFKTIIFIIFGLFISYWLIYVITPNVRMSAESKAKIDSLSNDIIRYEKQNRRIDTAIAEYNTEIHKIDSIINNIKQEKTIIKEFYHEKIISVDTFSKSQIDSFFAKRYRLNP